MDFRLNSEKRFMINNVNGEVRIFEVDNDESFRCVATFTEEEFAKRLQGLI